MAIKAYYRFNGNSNDASGGGNNGTDTEISYLLANGKLGNGAGFNGTSSYIILPNSAKGGNSLTVSAWIRQASAAGVTIYSESASAFAVIGITATGQLDVYIKTSTTSFTEFLSIAGVLPPAKWHHVIYAYDSTSGYLYGYVDSIRVINQYRGGNQSYLNTLGDNAIGIYSYNNHAGRSGYFNGGIDEFKIDNTIWTEARIKNEYARVKGFF